MMRTMPPTALVLLVLILVAAAPLAAAQAPVTGTPTKTEVVAEEPKRPIPAGSHARVPLEVTYCTQPGAFSTEPTPVEVTVNSTPSWVEAAVSPSTLEFAVGPQEAAEDDCSTQATNLTVTVASSAPEYVVEPVEVLAEAQPNGALGGSSARTDVMVKAGPSSGNTTEDVNATGSAGAQSADDAGSNGVPAPPVPLVALALVAAAAVAGRLQPRNRT